MATTKNSGLILDPKSGFCSATKTFHSLRPSIDSLPPPSQPLSITQYSLSLLRSTSTFSSSKCKAFVIDALSGQRLTYSDFLLQLHSLSLSLQTRYSLSKGDVAFILTPRSLHIPVLYFSLLSIGVILSPANPLDSHSEISHQIHLSKPSIAFATSGTSQKLPSNLRTILVDSPGFISLLAQNQNESESDNNIINKFTDSTDPAVNQSDSAVILYSSGTTGKAKGALLTHRNLIVAISMNRNLLDFISYTTEPVAMMIAPLFQLLGFSVLLKTLMLGETLVFVENFDCDAILGYVEKYKVTYMPLSPSVIVKLTKSQFTKTYDLSSLQLLFSTGSPLGVEVAKKFNDKFPHVIIFEIYGMTEAGPVAAMRGANEAKQRDSVGRLNELIEAKIVNPVSGEALPPGQEGELWLRGPTIMKGYVGDDKATSEMLDSEGWLKTGDLCYFDSNGFLFIVDRLKELIKYMARQVPPAELEDLLLSNPEIADAAVVGYPDEEAGQIPMAFVVRRPGSNIDEVQVMDIVANQVSPYKKIRRVAFIESIPKTPLGKILRRELLSHALSGTLIHPLSQIIEVLVFAPELLNNYLHKIMYLGLSVIGVTMLWSSNKDNPRSV